MDQSDYLSQTLWEYRGSSEYTDITLLCKDGSLPAHAVMLDPLFRGFGISFLSREEVPECLLLPDLTTSVVFKALKSLYLQNKRDILQNTRVKTKKEVKKKEISNYDQEGKDNNETVIADISLEQNNLVNISCNLCAKKFSQGQDYRKHKYIIHEQDEDVIWKEWEKIKSDMNQKLIKEKECTTWSFRTKGTNDCKYCNKVIKGSDNIKMHYALKHREDMITEHPYILLTYPCFECDLMFLGSVDRTKHLHDNHGKAWICKACGKTFVTRKKRLKHRLEHADEIKAKGITTGIKDQECPYCHKMYEKLNPDKRWRPNIDRHTFNLHKNKLFNHPEITSLAICNVCNTEFYCKQDLEKHEKLVHSEIKSVCQVCSKVTSNKTALREHMNVHSNETHVCKICSLTYRSFTCLRRHHYKIHQDKLFACKLCTFTSQTDETLQKHILQDHSGVQYFCVHCPLSYKKVYLRNLHEKRSHGQKTEKCKECDKTFSDIGYMNAHIKSVHQKEKDKICPHCGEAFFYVESFKIHVLRHTNNRQFPCEVCGKYFLSQRDVQSHMGSHTLPYKCDKCEKCYASKHALKDHTKMRHEGIRQECRFSCGYENWYKRQCMNHEKTCSLNPVPGAPYSVAVGTASSLTLQRYHNKLGQ